MSKKTRKLKGVTIEDARLPSLRDKQLAADIEARAARLEKASEVEKEKRLKVKKEK